MGGGARSYLIASFALVTVLAALSAVTPPRMLTFGMLALGPALAAASASPAGVLALGGYALVAAFAISTGQGLLGTLDQSLRLLVMVAITGISWALARHHRRLLAASADAAREREMLAAFAEQSSDAVIGSSLDGVITSWNGGAERLYGYPADEIVGSSISRILPPERRDVLDETLTELAAGRRINLDEVRRIRRDGSEMLVSVAVSPIRDTTGRIVAAAATERDVTDKKRRVRAERMESLGQLAGGVAHDFNNLLAIIVTYADLMADEVTPAGARDLARIRDAADRAGTLTSQLLLFAKREPTQVETVDLNTVVTDAQELLSRSISGRIRLACRPHSDPVTVRANRGRLDQILMNLVINARDAMPDGGDVVIGTGRIETPSGTFAELTVSDTGTGMSAEVRERLFEPFFTTKPVDQGTGLGLSTVYGIVTDAGGRISVDSAPGAGTTFVIRLPLVPALSPVGLGAGESS
ncbi:two-component system sensor histidine kinase NtrB [Actinoplanes xinjiangensis]|uniref:two-component system sensor histidine kinase NtrB n=1 Tax=Actinoplanes xinjiangensis TaxID=512350 RepID=UPI003443E033